METSRATGRQMLEGIVQYSRLHGPWVFYSDPSTGKPYLPAMKGWHADGIIANVESESLANEIKNSGIPAITKVIKIPGIPHVSTNEPPVVKMAIDYFQNKGIEHFAYFGIRRQYWSNQRHEAFSNRLSKNNILHHSYEMNPLSRKRSWQDELEKIVIWVKSLPSPIGILVGNDLMGRYLIEACKEAQIRIPDEAIILGVDNDILFCEMCTPPLSSINMSLREAGFQAAAMLAELMNGKKMIDEEILIEPLSVMERSSTNILAFEDQNVVRAIRFIRDNASRPIYVDDVVEASNVSRRVLEKRFKKGLNRSILVEIRRARVEKIKHFLTETTYPISKIAYELGFPGKDHIARYFKLEVGMSPQAFRRKYGIT